MKTVWIYVNTATHVGDNDHLQVFANEQAAKSMVRRKRPRRRCCLRV